MQRVFNIKLAEEGKMKKMVFESTEVKAVRVILAPGERSADCTVDAPVLLLVMEGGGTVFIEGESHSLNEGDVTLIESGKERYLQAKDRGFRVLAIQSHQADKRCGLCTLLESCIDLKF